jgi:Protein of unknown function (DUF3047)
MMDSTDMKFDRWVLWTMRNMLPRLIVAMLAANCLDLCSLTAQIAHAEEIVRLDFEQPDKAGTPKGWKRILKEGTGTAKVVGKSGRTELHTETAEGLLRFERELEVDPTEGLRIAWEWKVDEMPATPEFKVWDDGGRKEPYRTNSPIQVLVAFRNGRSVYVIHYVWEPTVEVDATWYEQETKYGVVTMNYVRQVVQSGPERMHEWHPHEHDAVADFKTLFPGKKVPKIVMVAIQSVSSYAEGEGAKSRAAISKLRFVQK